ncbi:MAG: NAD-dependent epimerase/dehydratase family protein [Magnetovibrionaceae bacterium]
MTDKRNVMVTGGAGYVGSALIPALLADGHRVTVLDLYLYGEDLYQDLRGPNLIEVKGDLRDASVVAKAMEGVDAVIHLACISNDPSFELDPDLGKSINYDAFRPLVRAAKAEGVERFIYASSSSVYGIKDEPEVTEDLSLEPLTDYSKFKAMCEGVLAEEAEPGFNTVVIRPSTVCGYAPRLRLDLIVNILTNHAINNGKIRVFGGDQKRPNIHIKDMVNVYRQLLSLPGDKINGGIYNAGCENHTVNDLAGMVQSACGGTEIEVVPTDDNRSYHVSAAKIREELGIGTDFTILDAINDLKAAFDAGLVNDPMDNPMYFNIKRMQQVKLS